EEEYPDPLAIGILTTAGVEMAKWNSGRQTAEPYDNTNSFAEAQDALRRKWRAGDFHPAPPPLPVAAASGRATALPLGGAKPFSGRGGKATAPTLANAQTTVPRPAPVGAAGQEEVSEPVELVGGGEPAAVAES